MSVVTASGSVAGGSTIVAGAGVGDFPADADYYQDEVQSYVYDPSMEPLETINMILCMMEQTAADEMVNEGAYQALIDEARCEAEDSGGGGSSTGASTGAQGTQELNLWTVASVRPDNASPQRVRIWVPHDEEEMAGLIYGRAAITRAPTSNRPFGSFKMDFAMKETLVDPPMFSGVLETVDPVSGAMGFSFYQDMGKGVDQPHLLGEFSQRDRVTVNMSRDQGEGVARVQRHSRYNMGGGDTAEVTEHTVAFDDTHLLRAEDGGQPLLFHRDQYERRIWGYSLYHADGAEIGNRIDFESGFPIRTEQGEYGWVGYHGLWLPEGSAVGDGDTVYRDEHGRGRGQSYTVQRSAGRLYRHERETLALSEIDGQWFGFWESDPQTFEPTEYRVEYQHANGSFWKIAQWDPQGGSWNDLQLPELIVLQPGEWLHLWSDGLGGSITFVQGETTISFQKSTLVTDDDDLFGPGATHVELYGLVSCLDTAISQADAEQGNVYLADSGSIHSPYVFRFDRGELNLYHDVNGDGLDLRLVGLDSGVVPESGPNQWGMHSGPLVPNLPNTYGTVAQVWDMWGLDEYYTYETGHNEWNQYTTVSDAHGATVSFDKPIVFSYTHSTANDANDDASYDGTTVLLSYEGAGHLWGIPQEGVDIDGDQIEDRWYPLFSIEDGVELGPNGNDFVVKGTDMELLLTEDLAGVSSLNLTDAAALTLPDGSNFQDPGNVARPRVDEAPAVIAGEVQ